MELDLDLPPVDRFAEFYDAYPLHRGRLRAEASWRRALKVDTAERIIRGAQAYAAAVAGWDAAAIQSADSFLSRLRWKAYVPSVPEWVNAPWADVQPAPSEWDQSKEYHHVEDHS